MIISIEHQSVFLGKANDAQLALSLDSVTPPPEELCLTKDFKTHSSFCFGIDEFETVESRYIALIKEALDQLDLDLTGAPVLFIPPGYGLSEESQLTAFTHKVSEAFPSLFQNASSRIYPYGRSSVLMLFGYLKELLAREPGQTVWVLAVDSYANLRRLNELNQSNKLLTEETGDGMIVSEGAIILGIKQTTEGLMVSWSGSDASVSHGKLSSSGDFAVEQLFHKLTDQTQQPLNTIYLPDNGDQQISNAWMDEYRCLAPIITKDTQMYFSTAVTGELGSVGGLYRLLHLYSSYKKGRIDGLTMQCEISDKLYRAVALYQWR
ncbi:hypothetical protein [Litoribrevibacter albus]|uniref:Uncharacterized protein n=1 Tax=Litoribrevibacter albus TaxID=1473156 RepID=A0AA37SCG3_9GAMM|nr:hypothetical protein [Litoribrevibacter albus]GLQ31862.1 hypothetical protein GCM10007876_23410 [Litoribrevibacter albus]